MSAVGGGMENSDVPAVYLLTLICGLSWILPWLPEVKKSPPGPELSAHRANLVKMNRITKQFTSITFNGCKALPRVFRSRHHAQGNRCALWIPPSCMALSLSSSLLLQMFSPFAIWYCKMGMRRVLLRKMQSSPRSVGWPLGIATMPGSRCSSPHAPVTLPAAALWWAERPWGNL